jgi:hypothetical protein
MKPYCLKNTKLLYNNFNELFNDLNKDLVKDFNDAKHLIDQCDYNKLNKIPFNELQIKVNHGKDPRKKYIRKDIDLLINHWGQRKLLLSEIQFLTKYYDLFDNNKKKYVLYVGAAHGIHIPVLSKLFPELNFILYDPSKFRIKENDKIKYIMNFLLIKLQNIIVKIYIILCLYVILEEKLVK